MDRASLLSKIAVEQKVLVGARQMYKQLADAQLQKACEAGMVETEQRIAYLTQQLNDLDANTASLAQPFADTSTETSIDSGHESDDFDLLKYSKTITTRKIIYKHSEIMRKLVTEHKVMSGTESLFEATSSLKGSAMDPRLEQDLLAKMSESNSKITVLDKARMRYSTLNSSLPTSLEKDEEDSSTVAEVTTAPRMASKARLRVRVICAANLVGRTAIANNLVVLVTVDGNLKFESKSTSTHWNETFDLQADSTQELELCVYSEPERRLLGLTWFKMGLLEEAVKAKAGDDIPSGNMDDVEDTWLDLEPAGQILVRISLASNPTKNRTKRDAALFRREGVQKAFPRNGHTFYAFQSLLYQCAVCNEHAGASRKWYRCQGCNYTCHAKCYPNVITKCVTLLDIKKAKTSDDLNTGQLLPYRIPHRFQTKLVPFSSWCSHCGSMMSPGRVEKCVDCSKCVHAACRPMMPSFCQLKPEVAVTLMNTLDEVERKKYVKELEEADTAENGRRKQELERLAGGDVGLVTSGVQMVSLLVPAPAPTSAPLPTVQTLVEEARQIREKRASIPLIQLDKRVSLEDFNLISVIGRGAFGKVMLIEEKSTNRLYAMKALKKDFLIDNDDVISSKLEKKVLAKASLVRHAFLVNLHSCFQTTSRLYYVMEYVNGGDLMGHIMQMKRFTADMTRFFASEILLAIEFLHQNDIVYRDLKLENILVCSDGHIKLTDFGICKDNMPYGQVTKTYCGTPDFMAPEILGKRKYGRSIDWWSFGIMIYVMLTGKYPYHGDDERHILRSIFTEEIEYPPYFTNDTIGLIEGLLTRDPRKRLGGGRQDAEEIKRQKYFAKIDWQLLSERGVEPPWKPTVAGAKDVSNFDAEFTEEKPVLTPVNTVLSPLEQADFQGFDFVADFAGM
ncbi:kinase-like domain-containing protein [Chytriomyces cf. hyalinus JEL632]|nr:kinase-like domain-containing protein [Chytriomyces cf. hyalinus JEL632]